MRFDHIPRFIRWFYRYRSIRLTPEGTRFVLLTLAVGVAAINTGNNLLYLLLAMMLSLVVLSGLLSEQSLRRLLLIRRVPEHIFANQPATAAFSITNEKSRFPTFSLRVMDVIGNRAVDRGVHLLHLDAGVSSLQPYPLLFPQRGLYRIEGVKLLTRFPFGLFIKAATIPLASEVVVYPELKPLPMRLAQELTTFGQAQTVPRRGPGVALYSLREYRAGDDSRTIHWKTSARVGRLIVRETEAEDQRHVTLALCTGRPGRGTPAGDQVDREAAFEEAVSLTASLAAFFHEGAYTIRLLVGNEELPYGSGLPHLYEIYRRLALCHPIPGIAAERTPQAFSTVGLRGEPDDLSIVILPWNDPDLAAACRGATRIVQITEERTG